MTGLLRTDLPTSFKSELAASAFARQGEYGSVTALAERYGVSRPTVYTAATEAQEALDLHYLGVEQQGRRTIVAVDAAQIIRALVALRVGGQNSIRAIEDILPLLYPGVHKSYGAIQATLVEAEKRAALFNQQADLASIKAVALDEMFSQGDPVLAGVCLDTGYLIGLSVEEHRSAAEWAAFLKQGKNQGLNLEVVVKDAAGGIAKGVRDVFPDAEQRDDCFHAMYAMGKVRRQLEAKAFKAIGREMEAEDRIEQVRRTGKGSRHKMANKLGWARRRCAAAVALHDDFERALNDVTEAMAFVDLDTARIRSPEQMESSIREAAQRMRALDNGECRRVGRYIHNRAPGLAVHMKALNAEFSAFDDLFGADATRVAAVIWRLLDDLRHSRRSWAGGEQRRLLAGAVTLLERLVGDQSDAVFAAVDSALLRRHRASSAIEGFNAALRPFLYVHKGVSPGFLELFRAHHNLKTRRWGRHKGTSAHECLTGEPVHDWLEMLGYAPSERLH
ncbi:MAG: hypothetical protein GY944_16745 [bacterium]|nr:hypothetical protein [bacterium]